MEKEKNVEGMKKYFAKLNDKDNKEHEAICLVHEVSEKTAKVQIVCKWMDSFVSMPDYLMICKDSPKLDVPLDKVGKPLTARELWKYLRAALFTRLFQPHMCDNPTTRTHFEYRIKSSGDNPPSEDPFKVYEFAWEIDCDITSAPREQSGTIFVDGFSPLNPGDYGYYDDERGR